MTNAQTITEFNHQEHAQRLRQNFGDACRNLEAILDKHKGVIKPDKATDDDEAIVAATSIMWGAVQAIHNGLGEPYLPPQLSRLDKVLNRVGKLYRLAQDRLLRRTHVPAMTTNQHPYSVACGEVRVQLEALLKKYPDTRVSLGSYQGNLWAVLNSFLHQVDTQTVAPSAEMEARRAKRPAVGGRALRPASVNHRFPVT